MVIWLQLANIRLGIYGAAGKLCRSPFRKPFSMDFYIAKYQGKMMQSLIPLFQTMRDGIHRLQEEEKKKMQTQASEAATESTDTPSAAKKRKTLADTKSKARRVCIRLASMANRCYWLSTTEIAVHIITGGDCLHTHKNQRLFTRQLQWSLQQCKRSLSDEGEPEESTDGHQSVEIVGVKVRSSRGASQRAAEHVNGDPLPFEQHVEEEVVETTMFTTNTNTADDYAHRGTPLQTMPFYVYRMRVLRKSKQMSQQPEEEQTASSLTHTTHWQAATCKW